MSENKITSLTKIQVPNGEEKHSAWHPNQTQITPSHTKDSQQRIKPNSNLERERALKILERERDEQLYKCEKELFETRGTNAY